MIMFGIVVTLSSMMSLYSSRYLIATEVSSQKRFIGHVANQYLADISLTPPYIEIQTRKLTDFFISTLEDRRILSVRIWLRNGHIEMLKNNEIAFEERKPSEKVLRVFEGEYETASDFFYERVSVTEGPDESDQSEEEKATEVKDSVLKKRLAVFTPLYSDFSDRTNAVIEVIKDSAIVMSPIRRVQTMIWLITIVGLGVYPSILIAANAQYRKQKEEELERIKVKQLEAINSMVVTFNHEVNQPLTGICTYAELLRKASGDDENLMRFAENIYEQSIRLGELVKKISKITRVEMTEYVEGTRMLDLVRSAEKDPQTEPKGPSEPELF